MEFYVIALKMDDKNTEFLMNRAQCFYDQGQYELSIENLKTAHLLDAKNP